MVLKPARDQSILKSARKFSELRKTMKGGVIPPTPENIRRAEEGDLAGRELARQLYTFGRLTVHHNEND